MWLFHVYAIIIIGCLIAVIEQLVKLNGRH